LPESIIALFCSEALDGSYPFVRRGAKGTLSLATSVAVQEPLFILTGQLRRPWIGLVVARGISTASEGAKGFLWEEA